MTRLDIHVEVDPGADADGVALVARRVRAFADALAAGFFLPDEAPVVAQDAVWVDATSVGASLPLRTLSPPALGVLCGLLADCRHRDVALRAAQAVLGGDPFDLCRDPGVRPEAVGFPPFAVDLPLALTENPALLVEIEFADPVTPAAQQPLFDALALWSELSLACPVDLEEPAEAGGAQQHFNDPRTLHHHEWVWNNVDPQAWNLLVNLCCAWHRTRRVVRLHVE